jgi:threonyl-tRNA synthetase
VTAETAGETAQLQKRESHFFHVDVDSTDDTLSKRVRRAQMSRYNFICVVGEDELKNGTVNVRGLEVDQTTLSTNVPSDPSKPQLKKDMGVWRLDDLRQLFITLDDNHW